MQTFTPKRFRFLYNTVLAFFVFSMLILRLSPHALAADSLPQPLQEEEALSSEPGPAMESPAESGIETEPSVETDAFPDSSCPDSPQPDENPPEMGWLSIHASTPAGFSGSICIALQNTDSGESMQIQLDPSYIDGQWLPVGVYTVNAYVKNCDHFGVMCDIEITIATCADAYLSLTVTPDDTFDTYLEEKKAAFNRSVSYADELLIWNYLLDLTGNPYGAAGIMGNLYAESGLRATNLEDFCERVLDYDDLSYTRAVDEGSYLDFTGDCAGYGLAQWTYVTRKEKLYAYAIEQGTSIGDLEMQLRFLAQELSESGLLAAFQNVGSIQKASDIMLVCFEAPTDQSADVKEHRAKLCGDFYYKFALGGTEEMVQGQADVVRVATNSTSCGIPEDAFCGQRWAAQVYAAAGFPLDESCCAYHAALENGVSSDWSKIPPGAAVYGYSGSEYGHVGIYAGGGLVYHNNGTVTVDTLTDWIETYQGFCWGWEAGVDLTLVP